MNILKPLLKCFGLDRIFATKAEGKISDDFIQYMPDSEMNQEKSTFVGQLENEEKEKDNKSFFVERYNKESKRKDGKQVNLLS